MKILHEINLTLPRSFLPIASSGNVTVFAPSSSLVSFTNSPYYAHEHGSAVDIYPLSPHTDAISPVRGELINLFTVRSPSPIYFPAAEEEKLLIVRPEE